MLKFRKMIQIVFQDPYSSLDPRMRVGSIVGEGFTHINKEGKKEAVINLLEQVGLRPSDVDKYPHEFSGGQRQRICIARALAVNPKMIIADEPVSSLDVSIQAQILNLLTELRDKKRLSYLFISHDLSVVWHLCETVAVMYLGKLVEIAPSNLLFNEPMHPYTQALISAIPVATIAGHSFNREQVILEGEAPSALNPPQGCRFHPRCRFRMPHCSTSEPQLQNVAKDRSVRCYLYK
jgi:oligopeptide/dipeptide ABC transporter ATP-binding protein